MLTLGAIAVAIMVVILLVLFDVRWRLLPLGVILIGVVWAFGLAGYLHIPLTLGEPSPDCRSSATTSRRPRAVISAKGPWAVRGQDRQHALRLAPYPAGAALITFFGGLFVEGKPA